MKKAAGYYFKIVLAWMVTIVFACYFLSLLVKQIGNDKEVAGVNSQSIGMATVYDDVMSKDDAELDDEGKAEKRVVSAFEQIRKGSIKDALPFISEIEQNQYLINNKPSIREYFMDFSKWYETYKELERYYNMTINERLETTEPTFSKGIQAFIKSGACESYFGDKKSTYASLVPYQQFKLMNKLFNHISEDLKDSFIKKHTGAEVYKAYIDNFIDGKESLSDEDGNVICGYIYASFVGLRKNFANADAEPEALNALNTEIEKFQEHSKWKDDLKADGGKLSVPSTYLRIARTRIHERIDCIESDNPIPVIGLLVEAYKKGTRNYSEKYNLDPYTGWDN